MKTAAVRELRNHYSDLLDQVAAGEEVIITKRGKPVAKLGPVDETEDNRVDWSAAPEVMRDRRRAKKLSSRESQAVMREASGRW